MRLGFLLSKIIREVQSPSNSEREAYATLIANSLAFYFKINNTADYNGYIDECLPKVKKVISSVNENIALDTKLTIELFKQAARVRFELINGTTDTAIIKAALKSETNELYQTVAELAVTNMLVSNRDFEVTQNQIFEVLKESDLAGDLIQGD